MSKWEFEKENLEKLILVDKISYEEIGRQYGCTGSNIKKVSERLGIKLPQRRKINECETFNRIKSDPTFCLNCGKEIPKRNKYCNNICQNYYEYKQYIISWKNKEKTGMQGTDGISKHIKRYFVEKYDNKCQICGWNEVNKFTNKVPLTIHHIDGDCRNNKEENLELLCPNCHSLTENYGAANKNSTREYRYAKKSN